MAFFKVVLISFCIFPIMSGCERAPSRAKVIGFYSGRFGSTSETVHLRPDGTFLQIVIPDSGSSVTNTGFWKLDYKQVELTGHFWKIARSEPNEKVPVEASLIDFGWGDNTLVRDLANGGLYRLQKNQ